MDKLLGRDKKPAGDMTSDPSGRSEGMQEQQGMAEDRASGMEQPAPEERAAEHDQP
ncbi:MAG: hypothetical protein WBB74_08685 [Gaiellaceae bacterium]